MIRLTVVRVTAVIVVLTLKRAVAHFLVPREEERANGPCQTNTTSQGENISREKQSLSAGSAGVGDLGTRCTWARVPYLLFQYKGRGGFHYLLFAGPPYSCY